MKKNEKIVLVVVVLLVGVAFAWQAGFLDVGDTGGTNGDNGDNGHTGEGFEPGTYTMRVVGRDTKDIGTSRTAGTNFNVHWYAKRSGGWILLKSNDNVNIEVETEDAGYIWAVVAIPSGQAFYPDEAKTIAMNSRVDLCKYEEVDGNFGNGKEWAFRFNIENVPPAASGYPEATFYGYFLTYDSTWAISAPDDIASIGTTANTEKFTGWYMYASAEKKGVLGYKVEVSFNNTDTTKYEIDWVQIPGLGKIDGGDMTVDEQASLVKYTYTFASDMQDALIWALGQNEENEFSCTVAIKWSLAANDNINVSLKFYQYSTTGTTISDTDTCKHSA